MKKNKYDIEKICKYCERASSVNDEDSMLCEKKGIVSEDGCCRSFRYDPLKRIPHRSAKMPDINPEDLKI